MTADLTELLNLPREVRMEIAQSLWLSVAEESQLPLPAQHREILEQRFSDYQRGAVGAVAHEEMMVRLSSRE